MPEPLTVEQVLHKISLYCAYQERCHAEVVQKLNKFGISGTEKDQIIVKLIADGFLNEERFARTFARGKFKFKKWGVARIERELKQRQISPRNITAALSEISMNDYEETFNTLAEKQWQACKETHPLKKRKKVCDFLLRKGYDGNLVYEKVISLEKKKDAGAAN